VASVTRVARRERPDKRSQVEQALLEATERLLDRGASFTELSVEQLANEAGIARSTFYVYFVDKGELVRSLATRVTREMASACAKWWVVADQAIWDDLCDAMADALDVYEHHRAAFSALVETSAYDPAVAALFHDMLKEVINDSRKGYDRIKAAGKLNENVTRETSEALSLMVERTCYQLGRHADAARRKALAQALAHIVWSTVYAPSVPRTRRAERKRK
jgi:AcrR family transcriptional regulator